ncbi:hypothetical protein EYC84_011341 [Monilinia fructicola]|uniref:Plastocyanin-like domain-containing protein n=1 Tax=Monilinia fructicola TaxID=38448 RepID=A0A5M9J509_MONFR|nr:hypothetical protein EYC84_011341 [Monilinia fructicola]
MTAYANDQGSESSNTLDDVEIHRREDDFGDQEDGLLSDEKDNPLQEVEIKWRLKPIWVSNLFDSLSSNGGTKINYPETTSSDFRRSASDYVLDPNWDFNAHPKTRTYHWKIEDITANPDGVFRPMITINSQFPGPMIECNEGITQCPIAPGHTFRYEFNVTGQSGTYYYHGHQAVQIADGLYGPMIIHSKKEKALQKIPYATDRVVMLQDYYHELSSGLLIESLQSGSESSPIPDGALINGHNTIIPSFDLTSNANHRLRFINVGAFAWFQVSLDEHEFAITEVDGTDIMPSYETRMMISPAQRYSLIINTNHISTDLFWLRARMVTHCWKEPDLPAHGAAEVHAIIQGIEVHCRDMNTSTYIPTSFEPAPTIADHSYFLRANLERHDWRLERGYFNTSTFRPQIQHPTLHRTIDGFATNNQSFTSMVDIDGVNTVAYEQKHDFLIQHSGVKVVDIIIQNFDEGNHPMHLHGHKVWILGQGHGPFPGHEHALDNLIRRDVATVEGFGWLALRFVADNPGVWAFHCHLMWHGEAGMVMQFLDRLDEVKKWEVPKANQKLCEVDIGELEKGAVPKDEICQILTFNRYLISIRNPPLNQISTEENLHLHVASTLRKERCAIQTINAFLSHACLLLEHER